MGSQNERTPIVYVTAPYIPVKLLFNISTSNKPNILNSNEETISTIILTEILFLFTDVLILPFAESTSNLKNRKDVTVEAIKIGISFIKRNTTNLV